MNIDRMKTAYSLFFSLIMASTSAQTEIPLYNGKIPKSKDCGTENKTQVNQWGQDWCYWLFSGRPSGQYIGHPISA